jgi:hypothetical protein
MQSSGVEDEFFRFLSDDSSTATNSFADSLSFHVIPDIDLIDISNISFFIDHGPLFPTPFSSEKEPLELELDSMLELELNIPKPEPVIQTENPRIRRKTNLRIIGTLTPEKRREKIARYLEKRKRRNWHKKISYDCRKKVADHRLRVKGRFVTKEQAIKILGIECVKMPS